MGKMVGIDLGTTNSVVAIVDGPQARVLDNKDAKSQTRSAVSLKKRKGKRGPKPGWKTAAPTANGDGRPR